jgi:carboxypeptidase PM20D1
VLNNRTVREVFPDTLVAPGLMVAAPTPSTTATSATTSSSSRRSAPTEDLSRFHGTNERISPTTWPSLIRFYHRLLSTRQRRAPDPF